MHVDDIGGPSAGMMYSLGLIDQVSGEKLSGGKIIAGTGTMDDQGKSVRARASFEDAQAKRDGATQFPCAGIQLRQRCGSYSRKVDSMW